MSLHLRNLGPYRLLEPLGRGGMGVVYRAVHRDTGLEVALKTVRVLESGQLQSIRREIHALACLRHPGIVRILGEGVQEGLPWYAMELVEGETLRQHARRLRETPDPAPAMDSTRTEALSVSAQRVGRTVFEMPPSLQAPAPFSPLRVASSRAALDPGTLLDSLRLVWRLSKTLAFLHGEGIVHRDLKPSNVLIRAPWPVLVDFGLVSQLQGGLSREELVVGVAAIGTVAYMAPEQAQGQLVDARADLYALGCILFELLTGRPPFQAGSADRVLGMHLSAEPPPPSSLVEGIPHDLDRLVLRLLAKSPAERLGHADDVAAAMERLGVQDVLEDSLPRPRAYLYRPRFAGREDLLQSFDGHLSRLVSGRGGIVLLGGESGVGKTRLLVELGRRAAGRQILVLTGECLAAGPDASGASIPLQGLRRPLQAIADRCRERGLAETQRLVGPGGHVLALYEPAFAALPGLDRLPEPAELPPVAARLRLFVYLADTFAALAAEDPVLLLLDDLQLADDLTLAALGFLLRTLQQRRSALLVVATYRTEELGSAGRTPLRLLLESPQVQSLAIGRLDEQAVGALVSDMLALGAPAPPGFIRFLSRHSEGNPFFVAEFLRTAVDEALLFRDGAGRWQVAAKVDADGRGLQYDALPLPRSLRALVDRRLDGLSPGARCVVEAAAVLGRESDTDLLALVASLEPSSFLAAAAELVRRQVLEPAQEGRLRFAHDKLREFAVERIEPDRLRGLHRAAAAALGAVPGRSSDAALARHFEAAFDLCHARDAYLSAAREARRRYAHAEAEQLYLRFLHLLEGPSPQSIAVRNELGRLVLEPQGRIPEAAEQHEKALAEARAAQDRSGEAQSLSNLGWMRYRLGQFPAARRCQEDALALHRQLGDLAGQAESLNGLASLCDTEGSRDDALALYLQALEIHRASGDRRGTGRVLNNIANLHRSGGRSLEAQHLFEQALAIAREVGNRRGEGICLGNLGILLAVQGRTSEAAQFFEQSLAISREVGSRHGEGLALGNLGLVATTEGRAEDAHDLYQQALAIKRELGDRFGEGNTLTNLGLLREAQGAPDEARALFHEALDALRGLGPGEESRALRALSALERRCWDNLDAAQELLQRAAASIPDLQDAHLALCLCEQAHLELGQGRSALALLQQVRRGAAALEEGPFSELGLGLQRLDRAQQAFDAGALHRLFRGEHRDDIPEGLRRWLEQRGQWRSRPPR